MELTYAEVGATRPDGGGMPGGYRHVRREALLGQGQLVFTAAVSGLRSWRMQREARLAVRASAATVEPGVDVSTGFGPGPLKVWAPGRVVWLLDEVTRFGYGIGTLPGHPEQGEEGFVVTLDNGGDVRFALCSFSRPATWYLRLGAPAARAVQDLIVARYLRAMRRLTLAA